MKSYFGLTLAFIVIALCSFMFYLSLDPKNYFFYGDEHAAEWKWFWGEIAFFIVATVIEAVAFYFLVVSAIGQRFVRSTLILIALVSWFILNLMVVMHQPIFFYYHIWWVIGVLILSLSVFAYVLGKKLLARHHAA